MQTTAPSFAISPATARSVRIPLDTLQYSIEGWLLDSAVRQHSDRTIEGRKRICRDLVKFLKASGYVTVGTPELRAFIAYLPTITGTSPTRIRPIGKNTVKTYHGYIRTLMRWMVTEELIQASPFEVVKAPIVRADQVRPFTDVEIPQLLEAARSSSFPRRDEALVLFLLDTGVRVGELIGLRFGDLDLTGRRATVLGKGDKRRLIAYSTTCSRALWRYLKDMPREANEPVWLAAGGKNSRGALTRSGVFQIIQNLGKAAKIERTRCSPHTLRHTFAVTFLRLGGNVFSLQQQLGHTNMSMTSKYVQFANADIEIQSRKFSPADKLGKR